MTASSETPTKRIEHLTAHVPPDLADEVKRLAEEGNRSISREVAAALRAHVEREASGHDGAAHPLGSRGAAATEGV
jgi:hypothetical protein